MVCGRAGGSEGPSKGLESLPEGSEGLPEGSEGLPEGSEAPSKGSDSLPEGSEGLPGGPGGDGRTDGRTDVRTDGRNLSPFYRTSSPVGAAARKGVAYKKKMSIQEFLALTSPQTSLICPG